MTTTPPVRRSPAQIIDIVVGLVLAALGALTGVAFLAVLQQYSGLSQLCDGESAEGVRCSPGYLSGMIALGFAGVIFGWFLTTGFMVVRFLRRRFGFWLPLLGVAVMIATSWAISAALSAYLPAS
jgi:hypothetical protein